MYNVVKDLKPSNFCSFDVINSKIIRMSPHSITLWMTFTMNLMLLHGKFQKILKISRINPILKPNKNPMLLENYRLVCNLQTLKKILKEIIKRKLVIY